MTHVPKPWVIPICSMLRMYLSSFPSPLFLLLFSSLRFSEKVINSQKKKKKKVWMRCYVMLFNLKKVSLDGCEVLITPLAQKFKTSHSRMNVHVLRWQNSLGVNLPLQVTKPSLGMECLSGQGEVCKSKLIPSVLEIQTYSKTCAWVTRVNNKNKTSNTNSKLISRIGLHR